MVNTLSTREKGKRPNGKTRTGGRTQRRRYYRIDDLIALSYDIVPDHKVSTCIDRFFNAPPERFTLVSDLHSIDMLISSLRSHIRHDLPDVSMYLEAINQKIERVAQAVVADEERFLRQPIRPVNLSAGGIGFRSLEPIERGRYLEMRLILLPSYSGILTYGKVVFCRHESKVDADFPYRIGVDFWLIRDPDKEVLIQHVTGKQAASIREAPPE